MFEILANPEAWIALLSLIALEIILGIDNIIFISILVGELPPHQRNAARRLGIGLALVMRMLLLFSLAWLIGLVEPWFTLFEVEFSGRDLILIAGGLFLLAKSTHEIHNSLERLQSSDRAIIHSGYAAIILQIGIIDMVFSVDSVITAIGLVDHLSIMVIAILVSMVIMLLLAGPIGEFVEKHPTFKMLALAFLILIGATLVAEGLDFHIPRGYIYFAMTFSIGVEFLNMLMRKSKQTETIKLNKAISASADRE
ncbi:MAG: TerC family protein [Proteobacteria bacterium]|nr:TerC family protein [Pseudomonadota bacterium]